MLNRKKENVARGLRRAREKSHENITGEIATTNNIAMSENLKMWLDPGSMLLLLACKSLEMKLQWDAAVVGRMDNLTLLFRHN